jgi:uncharacterized protein YkwD
LLAVLGALVAALSGGPVSSASADACHRFGPAQPTTISRGDAERAVVCLINRKRRAHGLGSVSSSSRLAEAAGRHSAYMENHHCFSHQCSGEPSLASRLSAVDYLTGVLTRWLYGENIAWGESSRGTPRSIVQGWMHSSDHRAIILTRGYRDIGVGVVWGTPQREHAKGGIYTADFGYRAW